MIDQYKATEDELLNFIEKINRNLSLICHLGIDRLEEASLNVKE